MYGVDTIIKSPNGLIGSLHVWMLTLWSSLSPCPPPLAKSDFLEMRYRTIGWYFYDLKNQTHNIDLAIIVFLRECCSVFPIDFKTR